MNAGLCIHSEQLCAPKIYRDQESNTAHPLVLPYVSFIAGTPAAIHVRSKPEVNTRSLSRVNAGRLLTCASSRKNCECPLVQALHLRHPQGILYPVRRSLAEEKRYHDGSIRSLHRARVAPQDVLVVFERSALFEPASVPLSSGEHGVKQLRTRERSSSRRT